MELRALALAVAEEAHAGQIREDGSPYLDHLRAVADSFEEENDFAAAILRDTVDGSSLSFDDLRRRGVPEPVVEAVAHLTRRRFDTYFEYLMRSQKHPVARRVMLADVTLLLERAEAAYPRDPDHPAVRKYRTALEYLSL